MLTKTLSNWFCCLLLFFIRHPRLQKSSDVFRLICPGDSLLVAPRLSETAEVTFNRRDFEFESIHPIRGLYQQLPSHLSGPQFRSNLTKGQHLFEFKAVDSIGRSAICVFTITVEVISCPKLSSPTFGEITCDSQSYIFGTKCTLVCPQGYASHGHPIECLDNGSWQGHLLHCHAITCPDPGIPLHGNRHCSSRYFVYNSSCSFTCQHGYRLLGNKDIRCLTTNNYYEISEWSNTAPTCQKIIPPIVEECPTDIVHVVTSRSEVEVALPSIVFRSSISGVILNHICKDVDLKESHNVFPIGLHNIRCFASEPGEPVADSSSSSHCNITIHVEADPCQPLPQPINGFLFCSRVPHFNKSHELGLLLVTTKENRSKFIEHHQHYQPRHNHHHHSTTCRMFCRSGFVFPKTFGRYLESRDYKCSRHEGVWKPFSFVPGCVLPKAPSELKLPVEIQFNIVKGDCSMLTTVSQSLIQSQLKSTSICSRNQKECLVEEWSVVCQRLDPSGGFEPTRRKRKRKKRNFGRNVTNMESKSSDKGKDQTNQNAIRKATKKSQRHRHRTSAPPRNDGDSNDLQRSTDPHKATSVSKNANRKGRRHHRPITISATSFLNNATLLPFRTRPKTNRSSTRQTAPFLHGRERRGIDANTTNAHPTAATSPVHQFENNQPKINSSEIIKAARRRAAISSTDGDDRVTNRMLVRFQLATRLKNGASETEASPKKWASDYHRTVVFLQSMYHALEELLASGSLNILQLAEESLKGKESNKTGDSQASSTVTSVVGYAVTAQADIIPVCDFEYEFNKDYLICVPCGPNTFYDTSTGQCSPCPEGTSQPDQAQFSCS